MTIEVVHLFGFGSAVIKGDPLEVESLTEGEIKEGKSLYEIDEVKITSVRELPNGHQGISYQGNLSLGQILEV